MLIIIKSLNHSYNNLLRCYSISTSLDYGGYPVSKSQPLIYFSNYNFWFYKRMFALLEPTKTFSNKESTLADYKRSASVELHFTFINWLKY